MVRRFRGLTVALLALAAFWAGAAGPGEGWGQDRQPVFELGDPPETRHRLAPFLSFGAELEAEFTFLRNTDLDRRRDDDTAILQPELSLAWSFDPHPAFQVYLNVVVPRPVVLAEPPGGTGVREEVAIEVNEAFALARGLPWGLALQVGRQQFEDEREWLYDEELDALRLFHAHGPLAVELSLSREALVRKDLLHDRKPSRVDNWIAVATCRVREELDLQAYLIARKDHDANRRRPVFAGLRSWGEAVEDLDYWVDAAWVGGRDGAERLGGWAIDLGGTYEWQLPWKPALTLAFAFGTGDRDPGDRRDHGFRQTGLGDNEGDFGGATSFKYYGAVLEPELSNLLVVTAGIGIRPEDTLSLDVVYHYYRQHRAADSLRDAGIDADPSGRRRELGHAVDLVLGAEGLLDRVDLRSVLGYFFPGAAFPGARGAWVAAAEVQVRF